MKVLALEPFYGGSHRAFLDGWSSRSHHNWTILHLPASKWKWRMRHSAITFTYEIKKHLNRGDGWDVLFCSDMLDLATFLGLCDRRLKDIPSVAYFHENQLTYPVRTEAERDYHFAMTNLTTCLAASAIWFNSEFHRNSLMEALPRFLQRMPDPDLSDRVDSIAPKTEVVSQGIDSLSYSDHRIDGPLRILWVARWEHDKNPEDFFEAMKLLKDSGAEFRLDVLGEQCGNTPEVFSWARDYFRNEICRWGFLESREEYLAALQKADTVVSTANHEFFGVSVVEAIASGAYPLLPLRLAYPEVLNLNACPDNKQFFYDGSPGQLAERLVELARELPDDNFRESARQHLLTAINPHLWNNLVPKADRLLEEIAGTARN